MPYGEIVDDLFLMSLNYEIHDHHCVMALHHHFLITHLPHLMDNHESDMEKKVIYSLKLKRKK